MDLKSFDFSYDIESSMFLEMFIGTDSQWCEKWFRNNIYVIE